MMTILSDRVSQVAVHVSTLTFPALLSQAIDLAIPVIARKIGANADRIDNGDIGMLYSLPEFGNFVKSYQYLLCSRNEITIIVVEI